MRDIHPGHFGVTYGRGGPPLWTLMWLHICISSAGWTVRNTLQLSRPDVSVIQCGVGVFLRLNFLFKTHTHTHTQSGDAADLSHFMWVQCRQENKSVCAKKVDSPDFCHSSQDETDSEKQKTKTTILTWTRETENTHMALARLLSPSVHPPVLGCFYHPRFSKKKSCPGLGWIVAEKFGERRGKVETGAPPRLHPSRPVLDQTSRSR